jgi:hypothetical protein
MRMAVVSAVSALGVRTSGADDGTRETRMAVVSAVSVLGNPERTPAP